MAPTAEQLDALSIERGLHPELVRDSLDPEHLPKFERVGELNFLILRAYPLNAVSGDRVGDTVQELTQKIAVFYTNDWVLSLHRTPIRGLERLHAELTSEIDRTPPAASVARVMGGIFDVVMASYEPPIEVLQDQLEALERHVFGDNGQGSFEMSQAYLLKRRAAVIRRMLRMTQDLVPRSLSSFESQSSVIQDLRESAEHLYLSAEEAGEGVNSLLELHLLLASHRTNEVIRVLTIFSVFLLPLTVITGIYGMNFRVMPELVHPWGYPLTLLVMLLVTALVYFWLHRRGWLR